MEIYKFLILEKRTSNVIWKSGNLEKGTAMLFGKVVTWKKEQQCYLEKW